LRLLRQHFDSLVVHHITVVVNQTVLTVTGVGIERDVGHHAEFREGFLDCGNYTGHETVSVVGLFRTQTFQRRIDHRKNRHHGNP
jgi:hypothetical protein